MDDEECFEDILGFTKQTAMLLTGFGGSSEVIKEFKKRNISSEELFKLSETDLIILGADDNLIRSILTQLKSAPRKSSEVLTFKYRFDHLLDILKTGQQQLHLISAFIAYARLRLTKEQINIFVEPDKSLRASQALCIAAEATIMEIDDLKRELTGIYASMIDALPNKKKRSINLYVAVGGLGLTACVFMHLCKNLSIRIN